MRSQLLWTLRVESRLAHSARNADTPCRRARIARSARRTALHAEHATQARSARDAGMQACMAGSLRTWRKHLKHARDAREAPSSRGAHNTGGRAAHLKLACANRMRRKHAAHALAEQHKCMRARSAHEAGT